MESKKNTKKRTLSIRKIAMAGVLVAVAVAGSLISFLLPAANVHLYSTW